MLPPKESNPPHEGPSGGEEKLRVLRWFLSSSPPGQIRDVIADCRKLLSLSPEAPLPPMLKEGIVTYCEKIGYRTPLPPPKIGQLQTTPEWALLCKRGRSRGAGEGNSYLEPSKGLLLNFHVASMSVCSDPVPANAVMLAGKAETYRKEIEKAAEAYVARCYPDPTTETHVVIPPGGRSTSSSGLRSDAGVKVFGCEGEKGGKSEGKLIIDIIISSKHQHLKCFWASYFVSEWQVIIDDVSFEISGEMRCSTHSFEEGNVQSSARKVIHPITEQCSGKKNEEVASAVIKLIEAQETSVQLQWLRRMRGWSDVTLKSVRRAMPLTRQVFDWSPLKQSFLHDLSKRFHPQSDPPSPVRF